MVKLRLLLAGAFLVAAISLAVSVAVSDARPLDPLARQLD